MQIDILVTFHSAPYNFSHTLDSYKALTEPAQFL